MSAPWNIAQASDLVDKSIQKMFIKSSDPEMKYKKYFNTRTTTDYYEKDSSISGLGEAGFVNENGVIVSDTPVQGYDKTYTQNMVAIIVPFTHRMWKFGISKRDLTRVTNELRKAIARKKEKLCAERLDNGFESTSYTHVDVNGNQTIVTSGGDGLGVIDDDHTSESGGANINNYVYDGTTYNLPFGYAGLKAAHKTMAAFVDPRGNPRAGDPDLLICKKGSSVYFKAMEIRGAIQKGKIPEEFSNDGAGVPSFEVLALDYLQNAAYWWMYDGSKAMSGDEEGFQFVESQPPEVDQPNIVYKTKEIQTSATTMFDLGHNDNARCMVGSKGDSSSPNN